MARSDKIYVVFDAEASHPDECFIAAFTVKHEMITWVQRNRQDNVMAGRTWQLCRFKDGGNRGKRELDALPDECWEEWVPR